MIQPLKTDAISLTTLAHHWKQVSFNCDIPLRQGMRLRMGETRLAPWRWQGERVDCLALPDDLPLKINPDITIETEGTAIAALSGDSQYLLTGENLAIADALLLAQCYQESADQFLVLLAADSFPFTLKPARFMVSELPQLIAACPLLEDWGFANRLASEAGLPGCFEGNLTELLIQLNTPWEKTTISPWLRGV
jgi:hypothetical protein